MGIQLPNINSQAFKQSLENGKTILFIDIEQQQELTINKMMVSHPTLKPEGMTTTTPEWLIRQKKNYKVYWSSRKRLLYFLPTAL